MKVLTVVGARPQFIKAAIMSKTLAQHAELDECLVHTGQHYDDRMSQVFFDELEIPRPAYNLQIGSATHGAQTGRMLEKIDEVMRAESPDVVLVYGDTNSTLAGALAAVKLDIPVAHVEAGLRSFNTRMPEEINRVVTDRVSSLLFCPTPTAVENLSVEGIIAGVHLVGDVMYDCALYFSERARSCNHPLSVCGHDRQDYILMTCHRAENTDDPARLNEIVEAANSLAETIPIVFPVHPRTRKQMRAIRRELHPNIRSIEPISYLEMLLLERGAALILTDSGGVQKEAFIFGVPCVTLRAETEWPETLRGQANLLTEAHADRITEAVHSQLARHEPIPDAGECYGEAKACERIARLIHDMSTSC